MNKSILILFISLIAIACDQKSDYQPSKQEVIEQLKKYNDSIVLEMDSLTSLKVNLPQLLDSSIFSKENLDQFHRLASETNGELKIVANSKFVSNTIKDIVKSVGSNNLDLMIIIDKTGSMQDDIENIKIGLEQIINSLNEFKNTSVSIALFGDKHVDGDNWFDYINLENDLEGTKEFIDKISVSNGGDYPESVFDGIHEAFQKDFWNSDSKRIAIVIGDAPSHVDSKTSHSLKDLIALAKSNDIHTNFYPIVLSPYDNEYGSPEVMQSLSFIESIYPNPTTGLVRMKFNQIENFKIEVYNQDGELVKSFQTNELQTKIELYEHPPGLYIIRVVDDKMNYDIEKIILKK